MTLNSITNNFVDILTNNITLRVILLFCDTIINFHIIYLENESEMILLAIIASLGQDKK